MASYEYDYQKFDEIITKLMTQQVSVEDEPEYCEIGEDISNIPSIKVIFDGFGLAEELYHDGRSFQLEDDVVMVQNSDYEFEPLDESDDDYEYVKEKLELFEEYRNSDGPCNPNMRSYAVFIHKDSAKEGFVFPPHDLTPWALIHRPKEEVCIYVWHDMDNDSFDILPLEDRIEDCAMNEKDVMDILERIEAEWLDDIDTDEVYEFPSSQSKLNPVAAWPFATTPLTSPPTVSDEEASEYEVTEDPAQYAPGELIRIEESGGKMYEIRQPSAEFSKSFPGVLDMIEIKDPNEPVQDYRSILEAVVKKHGLPTTVGAKGWISESQSFYYEDKHIATAEDGLKGWLYVNQDDDGDGEPSYSNVDELIEVCRAMVEDNNDDETSLNVNVVGAKENEWDIRSVAVQYDEADGKSWDYKIEIDEDEFWEIVKQVMIENGEIDEPEEGEEIDNDDIDVNSFLWGYCSDMGGESRYSYGYGVAYMEFADGFKVGMTAKNGDLCIHYYDGKDVTKDTVFDL